MTGLEILKITPSATVQDRGRVGFLRFGVTGGGAMDAYGLAEGQVLLGNGPDDAAIEFAEFGGEFRAIAPVQVALSGAEMTAQLNGHPVAWRRTVALSAGDVLNIGAAKTGVYGYLHVGGGFQTDVVLGSRSTHLRAGFGHVLAVGQKITAGSDRIVQERALPAPNTFESREIRAMWGPQSHYFSEETRAAFSAATLEVLPARDRMGICLSSSAGKIKSATGLSIASDAINLGDIQVTGDGTPTALLADRGSSGGYPRIATLITADLGPFAQLRTGSKIGLRMVKRSDAVQALDKFRRKINGLPKLLMPLVRDPWRMDDLLSYNLVDGVLRGDEDDAN